VSLSSRAERRVDGRLQERLSRLDEVVASGRASPGRLPPDLLDALGAGITRAQERLGHGTERTVVALAGATGSGKSSLFNALAGTTLADVGVRRPTTSSAQAAVFGPGGAVDAEVAGLLDWLGVARRHVAPSPADANAATLDGLVLLDLPDHDSTALAHRDEVDRLVEVVDAFVWVVDPQKYADMALHERYLRRFAGHGAVSLVVLNQVDLVPEHARRALVADLGRLLRDDGAAGTRILPVSTRTGAGVAELRRELAARVAERRAVVARLAADVDAWADRLAVAVGDTDPRPVQPAARERLVGAFAAAAGVDAVAHAVGAAHVQRARQVAGWPPTKWLGRLRPDPLRRLGLDRRPLEEGTVTVARTSRASPSVVAEAAVTTAIRSLVDDVAGGLPDPWRRRVAEVASARRGDVADELDRAVGTAVLPTQRPRWWAALGWVQRVLAAAMVAGLLWLLAIGVVAWFGLPDLPTPHVGRVPWPTALALGGAVTGLVLAAIARVVARAGARARSARARRSLHAAVERSARELVVGPVDEELGALAHLRRLVLGGLRG